MGAELKFKRILLKLSGEALSSENQTLDSAILDKTCGEVKKVVDQGCQIGIVVGGGNIFRGLTGSKKGTDRVTGDQMGMLATIINALALRAEFDNQGVAAEVMAAVAIPGVAARFNCREARRSLAAGTVLIFAGGSGNPFFTTDTAAALRAIEIQAEVLMKATKVDGVYNADPVKDPSARKFDDITYAEVIERQLGVMDITAITLCRENNMPVMVFSMAETGNILAAARGQAVGTIVREGG